MSVIDKFRELLKCRFTANQMHYERIASGRGCRATRKTFHQSILKIDLTELLTESFTEAYCIISVYLSLQPSPWYSKSTRTSY